MPSRAFLDLEESKNFARFSTLLLIVAQGSTCLYQSCEHRMEQTQKAFKLKNDMRLLHAPSACQRAVSSDFARYRGLRTVITAMRIFTQCHPTQNQTVPTSPCALPNPHDAQEQVAEAFAMCENHLPQTVDTLIQPKIEQHLGKTYLV